MQNGRLLTVVPSWPLVGEAALTGGFAKGQLVMGHHRCVSMTGGGGKGAREDRLTLTADTSDQPAAT